MCDKKLKSKLIFGKTKNYSIYNKKIKLKKLDKKKNFLTNKKKSNGL